MKIQEVNSDTDIELLHIINTSDIKDTEDPGKATVCKDERKYYTRIRCFRLSKEMVKGKYYY